MFELLLSCRHANTGALFILGHADNGLYQSQLIHNYDVMVASGYVTMVSVCKSIVHHIWLLHRIRGNQLGGDVEIPHAECTHYSC